MEPVGKSGAPAGREPAPESKPGKEPAESASPQDRDAFEKAMGGEKEGGEGRPQSGGPLTELTGLLAAMPRASEGAQMTPTAAMVPTASPGSLEAVEQVADRILVATPPPGSDRQEVRITLKEGVLPETDIQIVRDGESVSVTFRTENINANHFLSAHRTDLERRLVERLQVQVNVSLDYHEGDGRSRGQRNLYEEMEDNR